ncbi:MAG: alpha-amylase [Acidobacteria bacterium]|nr:alpha-amylase [Acidobacteriota bacterium]
MNTHPANPLLYQLNTRVFLTDLSRRLGRPANLDDVPDDELDRLAGLGADWVWFLSVWRTGLAGQRVSRGNPDWRREFQETLPDLVDDDIPGSGFAITGYAVHPDLGGDAALARLRERLRARGLRLMLDFVPNHTAPDHPWVEEHPGFYIEGTEEDLTRAPQNWGRSDDGGRILAFGRDPYFPGWPDTFQLNYGNPELQAAMTAELLRISGQCDGVRCDMSMLVLPEVFERTWGVASGPFWPNAIRQVKERHPGFVFMAEAYWDLEWVLQQQGFDYTYDKRLYDRLREGRARPVREHLCADRDFQGRSARFLENHDEPRAAATFPIESHPAAAVLTFLCPGLRFLHQGQPEGRRRRISPHLRRGPEETPDAGVAGLYERLLGVLRCRGVREGQWQLLECRPAWDGNWTWDGYIAFAWLSPGDDPLLVAVNFAPNQAQCYVRLPLPTAGHEWTLRDRMGPDVFERNGDDLQERGLYLDMPPWKASVFALERKE